MVFLKLVFLALAVALVNGGVIDSKKVRDYEVFLRESIQGTYEEPLTPELEDLQNYWERSGKFEGDILLTEDEISSLVKEYAGERNAILNTAKFWPKGVVIYSIRKGDFTSAQIQAIMDGIKEIETVSCIRFKQRTTEKNYVNVTGMNAGCYSAVGMKGSAQVLNLTPNKPGSGCFRHGTIVHEFLHAIGFYHMQSTHTRDNWVRIVWNKIQPGKENNFNKYTSSQVTVHNVPYDYGSVLHYSEYGFSIDGSRTIVPLKQTDQVIGQRIKMSPSDIKKLRLMYKC